MKRCRLKKVSDSISVSCVRLRFVFTKLIVPTVICMGNETMPPEKSFRRHLCFMRTITLCFHKANRTYGYLYGKWNDAVWKVSDGIGVSCVRLCFVFTKLIVATVICMGNEMMPSEKSFRRHLCFMRTITLCFHKANRSYVYLYGKWSDAVWNFFQTALRFKSPTLV